jgi:hypothetical protein
MKEDKKPKFKPRKKKVRFRNCAVIKGIRKYRKKVKECMNIAREYDCVWIPEDDIVRFNTIFGNKMRFKFKKTVMVTECHKNERWKRIASYNIKRLDMDQWRNALDYIAASYA